MNVTNQSSPCCLSHDNIRQKVFYYPIEAAILWCNLDEHEDEIFSTINTHQKCYQAILEQLQKWPNLHYYTERIYDAMLNNELTYGVHGRKNTNIPIYHPDASIRHIDLKNWLIAYYPTEKPSFLFNELEQKMISCIDSESISLLLHERDTLRAKTKIYYEKIQELEKQVQHLSQPSANSILLHKRTESSYLVTIGALLWLLLNKSPAGIPYSVFKNLESIIDVIAIHFRGVPGLSISNLRTISANAKKQLKQQL